jgi:hypothetical protein
VSDAERTAKLQVLRESALQSLQIEEDRPESLAFASNLDRFVQEVDVAESDAEGLGDPKPRGGEQREQAQIAPAGEELFLREGRLARATVQAALCLPPCCSDRLSTSLCSTL